MRRARSDESASRGYLFSHGQFTLFDIPVLWATYPTMLINPDLVVGSYTDYSNRQHGFLLKDGSFSTIDYPGSTVTWFTGLNSEGVMIGLYIDGTPEHREHGLEYNWKTDKFASFDVPVPGAFDTDVNGINNQGDIVGRYIGPDGKTHAYFMGADN